jgi:hypothetical protein
MSIVAAGQRRYLFEKSLRYLFSYDLPLEKGQTLDVPGGARLLLRLHRDAGASDHQFEPRRVYHVFEDRRTEGNDAIEGQVESFEERAFLPVSSEDKAGMVEGSIVIRTDDGAIIDSRYGGSISVRYPLRVRRERNGTPWGDGGANAGADTPAPFRTNVFIAPRFETSSGKYRWLAERQCAGFGVVEVTPDGQWRATYDFYALK